VKKTTKIFIGSVVSILAGSYVLHTLKNRKKAKDFQRAFDEHIEYVSNSYDSMEDRYENNYEGREYIELDLTKGRQK
jgi:hypothetical protein